MNKLKMALVAALALPSFHVLAEDAPEAKSDYSVSYNIGLFSQYIFRGYTQTHSDPALQGGVDVEHSSGFYAGAWASNISWLDDSDAYDNGGSLEIDLYAGYASEIGDTGISYDVGVLQYLYPGEVSTGFANANTTEVHVGLGYGWVDAAVHVVTSDDAWTWGEVRSTGQKSAKGSAYYEVNAEIPVGELIEHKFLSGVTGILHYGYQNFVGSSEAWDNNADSYGDWKVGLNKSFENGIDAGWYYTGTDVRNGHMWWVERDGKYLGDPAHTFYLTKSF
jgi:uncharacterized protein (TIGR02001 family)